jgi:hypothetical protein
VYPLLAGGAVGTAINTQVINPVARGAGSQTYGYGNLPSGNYVANIIMQDGTGAMTAQDTVFFSVP